MDPKHLRSLRQCYGTSALSLPCRYVFATLLTALVTLSSGAQVMHRGQLMTHPAFHRIAFERPAGEIFDSIHLGGNHYRFLLDTGAPLCISQELQRTHHFPVIHEADLSDANARHTTTTVVLVDSLRWGDMLFRDVPAVVLDIAHSPLAKEGVQGLLGSNVLRHLVVRFDAAQKEILFASDPALVHWEADRAAQGWLNAQDDLYFTCTIGGCFTDTVHFDSGMSDLYLIRYKVADTHVGKCTGKAFQLLGRHGRRSEGMLGKDKETRPARYHTISLRIASTDLGAASITTRQAASRMGRMLLALGTLTINYPEEQYIFEPTALPR